MNLLGLPNEIWTIILRYNLVLFRDIEELFKIQYFKNLIINNAYISSHIVIYTHNMKLLQELYSKTVPSKIKIFNTTKNKFSLKSPLYPLLS